LRAPGDILLLSTYELGHAPYHLAFPLGFLRRAGFAPRAIDLAVEKLDEEAVRRARLVAIAVPMHTALRLGERLLRRVRGLNPSAHVCCYGLYAPLNAAHLATLGADSAIGGEYEPELVALAERLERGAAGAVRPVVVEHVEIAPPEREGLPPNERYARLVVLGEERVAGYTEASRGCKHLCRHCPIPPVYGGRFFVVPKEIVLDDVRRQVAAGARHITFGDPDFLNGPGHALAIVRALPDGITFDFTAKIEHLLKHRELLPELAARGCLFVVSAVESLAPRVLEILDKGHTAADVDEALALTRAAGITLRPSLVPFTPWATMEDYLALLDWVVARDLMDQIDPVHLAIRLLIPQGSLLLARDELRPMLGPFRPAQLTWSWTHPDPRMDALQLAVMAAASAGADAGDDPRATVERIRALAHAAASGAALPPAHHKHDHAEKRQRPPKLTETWFC
jgi:radical SAM superfamily enzyme YgiQ (UPF0313 family)